MAYSTHYYPRPQSQIGDVLYQSFKVVVRFMDAVLYLVLSIYTLSVIADATSTWINIQFAGRAETGRLGEALWNMAVGAGNTNLFYVEIAFVSAVFIAVPIVLSLPVSPLSSWALRKISKDDFLMDVFDLCRSIVVAGITVWLLWETAAYVAIIPQLGIAVEAVLRIFGG